MGSGTKTASHSPKSHSKSTGKLKLAAAVEHVLLLVTYRGAGLHLGRASPTFAKLEALAHDFAVRSTAATVGEAVWQLRPRTGADTRPVRYTLQLLYQRTDVADPFSCALHVPVGIGCSEFSRNDTKGAFGHDMALRRQNNAPHRVNIGFWIAALWMMARAKESRPPPAFVWYLEDDVYVPGSVGRFLERYDRVAPWFGGVDLLVPQVPYSMVEQVQNKAEIEAVLAFDRRSGPEQETHASSVRTFLFAQRCYVLCGAARSYGRGLAVSVCMVSELRACPAGITLEGPAASQSPESPHARSAPAPERTCARAPAQSGARFLKLGSDPCRNLRSRAGSPPRPRPPRCSSRSPRRLSRGSYLCARRRTTPRCRSTSGG